VASIETMNIHTYIQSIFVGNSENGIILNDSLHISS